MPKNIHDVLERFEGVMADLVDALRDAAHAAPAGAGEVDDGDAFIEDEPAQAQGRIDDDTMVTLRSGDLRQVVDAYRTLSRMARTGRIPTQDERFKLHQHIRKVKHLIRKPVR